MPFLKKTTGKKRSIDYSDIPETDSDFWSQAKVVVPKKKVMVQIRLDQQVLDWFVSMGPRYQSRINDVLKLYKKTHQK